jgi:hypothetical protein
VELLAVVEGLEAAPTLPTSAAASTRRARQVRRSKSPHTETASAARSNVVSAWVSRSAKSCRSSRYGRCGTSAWPVSWRAVASTQARSRRAACLASRSQRAVSIASTRSLRRLDHQSGTSQRGSGCGSRTMGGIWLASSRRWVIVGISARSLAKTRPGRQRRSRCCGQR